MPEEISPSRRTVLGATASSVTGAAAVAGLSGSADAHSKMMPGVTTTDLNIRNGPGLHYDVIKTAQSGTGLYLTDGPWSSDGYTWWKMRVNACDYGGRVHGYAVERYTDYRPMIWPSTGTIESGDVYWSSRGSSYHRATDINGEHGRPVRAAASGTVKWVANLDKCGKSIKINHGNGYYTVYCHNETNHVYSGQSVSRGQHIADMGTSGNAYSWDPHVHFEVESPEHSELNPGSEIGHHVWAFSGVPDINY